MAAVTVVCRKSSYCAMLLTTSSYMLSTQEYLDEIRGIIQLHVWGNLNWLCHSEQDSIVS